MIYDGSVELTTDRDVFRFVKNHLITQGAASVAVDYEDPIARLHCAYRGNDGRACAVGCLISNEHYSGDLEGLNAKSPVVCERVADSVGFSPSRDMLNDLQNVHDENADDDVHDWLSGVTNQLDDAHWSFDEAGHYIPYGAR